MNKLIVITGPTGVGKTKLAVELAKKLGSEIVSADSMQIYKNMNIGTAKATAREMDNVIHHMIDIMSPLDNFSVNDYTEIATEKINEIIRKGKIPMVVGGTGLYINSLIYNFNLAEAKSDPNLRIELEALYEKKGGDYLIEMISLFDKETANKLHPNNKRRVIRAIEMYKTSGITMSEQIKITNKTKNLYDTKLFCLTMDRKKLYEKINKRVDAMIDNGLVAEVEQLLSLGISKQSTAMQAIGYKEIIKYFDNKISLQEAIECIKQESRRYAKRQLTWFRRDENTDWIHVDDYNSIDEIIEYIDQKLLSTFMI